MRHAPLAISRRRTRTLAWLLLIPTLSVCTSDTANGPVAAESDASARRSSIPGTVTSLSASAPGSSSVTLSFTQVSNGAGGPAKYDVRYAPSPLNWGTALSVMNGTCATPVAGSAVGATLTCTVLGLAASTKYDFRLIAFRGTLDVDAVFGGLSNVATATTTAVTTAGPASVTVTPSNATIALGERQTLFVAVKDQNGNVMTGQAVTWSSSNPTSVSVTSGGLITGVAAGSATITASWSGISGTSVITVIGPPPPTPTPTTLAVSPSSASIVAGATQALAATVKDQNGNVMTGQTVTWSSSNTAIASVNGSGVVTGVAAGSATITATSSGITGSSSITVTAPATPTPTTVTVAPSTASIVVGATQALAATVKDQNGNVMTGQTVAWVSSNPAVATVSSSGMVSGIAAGTATIAATASGKTGTASVTVTAVSPVPTTVTVSPSSASIVAGATQALAATVKDQNGNVMTGQTVSWSSGNTAAATVSGTGVVTGVAAGSATITATSSGKSGTASMTVTAVPPVPTTVTVSPSSASIVAGATQALAATVKDQNGNLMTGQTVTWSSSNTAAATVNGSGMVTGVAAGSATITATSSGKSGTASVTVTAVPQTPTTVTVAPSSASILAGATKAFTATVKDQNGNVMTGQTVTWASSNTAAATVSSSGLATGVAAGSATITATSSGRSGTASITVTAPPPPPPPGGTLLFQENFEDANLASRGWYDNTVPLLSTTEHVAGSTASVQFHWPVGATLPQTGAGGGFRHKFTPSNSFYVSYYVKYSTNWVGSGRPYHPHEFYISSTLDGDWDGPGDSYLTVYLEHNYQNGGLPVVGLQDSKSINKSYGPVPLNLIGVTESRAVAGCNGVSEVNLSGGCYTSSGVTGYSNGITVTGPVAFSPTPGAAGYKNNWNHVEAYYQMNSIVNGIGQADGVMQYWFNGQLLIDRRDMVFRTGAHATMQFNHFMMSPYIGDGSPVDQYMWVDNLKVATAPIP